MVKNPLSNSILTHFLCLLLEDLNPSSLFSGFGQAMVSHVYDVHRRPSKMLSSTFTKWRPSIFKRFVPLVLASLLFNNYIIYTLEKPIQTNTSSHSFSPPSPQPKSCQLWQDCCRRWRSSPHLLRHSPKQFWHSQWNLVDQVHNHSSIPPLVIEGDVIPFNPYGPQQEMCGCRSHLKQIFLHPNPLYLQSNPPWWF